MTYHEYPPPPVAEMHVSVMFAMFQVTMTQKASTTKTKTATITRTGAQNRMKFPRKLLPTEKFW